MYPSIILETLGKVISYYLVIFIGKTIGDFTNSIMLSNVSISRNNLLALVIALSLSVFGIPIYETFSLSILFKLSLVHDRRIISNFVKKDYSEAMNFDVGEISYRLDEDPIDLRWGIIDITRNSISVVVISTILIITLIRISIPYGAVCLASASLPILVAFFTGKLDARYRPDVKKYEETRREMVTDLCFNFVFIKMYKLKKAIIDCFSKLYSSYYKKTIKKSIAYTNTGNFLNDLFSSLSTVIVLLFGAWLLSRGKIEAGAIASMLVYLGIAKDQCADISNVIKQISILPQCIDRVGELYDNKEEIHNIKLPEFKRLETYSLSYSYDGNKKVFNDISLSIREGEKLAIAGHNGTGKSTVIKILTGLYSDYHGNVEISGTDLKQLNMNWWRGKIAYIEQDPFIFKGTVYENVRLGDLNASRKEVEEILKCTGLSELAEKQAEQFGENFSSGEIQRISIARALLKKSDILFVDEPFNNLDSLGKKLIEELFSSKSRTIVFVSHDEPLLKYADKVYNMDYY